MSLLAGGGETGKLIRAHDWSDSSLGTPDNWPQSLKTTLSIILHSRFPMFLFWGREHICFYNDAYRPSLGNNGKHPDAIGRKGDEVWPEIWDFIKPLIDQAMISGEATWHENQLLPIFRNGQMEDVYWTFSYSPVNDESGSHAGVLVTCTETTNSVLALTSMRESEQRFKSLINQATVGVVVLMGKELKIEVANDKYCELIRKPRQMLIGRKLFDVHPEAEEEFRPVIEEVLLNGRELHLSENTSWIKQDEEQLPVYMNLTYQPYKELDGKIGGVIVLVTDITEQVNALRKIAFEEERSRLAIDSAELGVFEVELPSNKMLSNSRFDALFGYSQPVTRNEYAAALIPEDLPVRNSAIEKALASGNLAYEVRVKWKDGSIHWIKVNGRVFKDEDGEPVKMLGVVQETTEQKSSSEALSSLVTERTRELSESNIQLQNINSELQQFVHVSSHDLQEPLRKIQTYVEMISHRDFDKLSEDSRNHFTKISSAAGRLSASLKGLLEFNSLNREEQYEETNLNTIIENVQSDLELLIEQKNASLIVQPLPVIRAIPVQMQQLLYNLVNNALKFSKPDTEPVIRIECGMSTATEENDYPKTFHHITVTDNGIGFDPANAEKIFVIFQRLHDRRSYSGTGIGLALCRKVVQNHNGKIWAESREGKGATFHILIPRG